MKKAFLVVLMIALVGFPCMADEVEQILLKVKPLISQKKDIPQTISVLEEALAKFPGEYRLWLTLGIAYESNQDLLRALNAFFQTQKFKQVNGLDKRIAGLMKRLEVNPKQEFCFPKELFRIGKKEKANDKLEQAFQDFYKMVKFDPKWLEGNDNGLIAGAIEFYKAKTGEKKEEALFYLGFYHAFAGNFDEAISEFKKFIVDFKESARLPEVQDKLRALEAMKALEIQPQAKTVASETKPATIVKTPPRTPLASDTEVASGTTPVVPVPTVADKADAMATEDLLNEAEAWKNKGKPRRALFFMQKAANRKKDGKLLMEIGDMYTELFNKNDPAAAREATIVYRKIMEQFPNSQMAEEAAEKIRSFSPSEEQRAKEVKEFFEKHGFGDE